MNHKLPVSGQARRNIIKMTIMGAAALLVAPFFLKKAPVAAERKPVKTLTVYFSKTGTTREVAGQINQIIGGDLVEIKPVHAYPEAYRATTDQAKKEKQANARPEIIAPVQDIASYDTVFIGYPNWWGTMPMAVFTFLDTYDMTGKMLVPFCTHEGSRMGNSEDDLRAYCPKATILEGLALRGGGAENVQTASARRAISEWLKALGLVS